MFNVQSSISLRFHKYKIDGSHQTKGCSSVIPVELLVLEYEVRDDGEDHQRDTLLDDLQLHKVERAAIIDETQTVSWHLTAVLEEGDHP